MLGKIGNITIGGGFPVNDENHKIVYPTDRLAELLRVDSSNEKEVEMYCNLYTFIPRDLTKGLQNGFEQEQEPIRTIAKHIVEGKITDADIAKINTELQGTNPSMHFIDKEALQLINDTLSDMKYKDGTYSFEGYNNDQIIATKQHQNTVVSLYEELYNCILGKRILRECPNCGTFFVSKNEKKIFCSDDCRDKHHKKVTYHSKK